jgi:hypothetical protein
VREVNGSNVEAELIFVGIFVKIGALAVSRRVRVLSTRLFQESHLRAVVRRNAREDPTGGVERERGVLHQVETERK